MLAVAISLDNDQSIAGAVVDLVTLPLFVCLLVQMETLLVPLSQSLAIMPSEDNVRVHHDSVFHRSLSGGADAPNDKRVTMVVKLHIRSECWREFRSAYLAFLQVFHAEQRGGHLSVAFFHPDGRELDRQLSTPPAGDFESANTTSTGNGNGSTSGMPVQVFEAVHTFESLAQMKAALGSKVRNDWDVRLQAWTAKDPEFYSYSGLTGFFSLNRAFNGAGGAARLAQPPPKWKIGVVIFMVAVIWAFVLDFTNAVPKVQAAIFPLAGPPSDGQRAAVDVVMTVINLLPVFFLWAPLVMEVKLIGGWLGMPWAMPGPPDHHSSVGVRIFWRPLRWVFF